MIENNGKHVRMKKGPSASNIVANIINEEQCGIRLDILGEMKYNINKHVFPL